MVSTLDKKLVRDLWRMLGQLAAVALVAMCGTVTFMSMAGAYDALVTARDPYYRDYRFADVLSTDAVKVKPGAAARIEQWGGDESFPDRVRSVEP